MPGGENYAFGTQNAQFWKDRKKNMKDEQIDLEDPEWLEECKKADVEIEKEFAEKKFVLPNQAQPFRGKRGSRYTKEVRQAIDDVAKEIYQANPSAHASVYLARLNEMGIKRPDGTEMTIPDVYTLKSRLGLRRVPFDSVKTVVPSSLPTRGYEDEDNGTMIGGLIPLIGSVVSHAVLRDDQKIRIIEICMEAE
jgi:hypothetical protein